MIFEGFLKPENVVEAMDVRPGEKIADFGCGSGFFSVLLAQRTGPSGRVYALDIQEAALEATRSKVKLSHVFNVETVRANLETQNGSSLRAESVDKVIIANILFQAESKDAVIAEAYRVLRSGGKATVIEWSDTQNTGGPFLAERMGEDETKKLFEAAGFVFGKNFDAGTHHYGLIFSKK